MRAANLAPLAGLATLIGQVSSQESSENGTSSIFVSPGDLQSRVAFGISIPKDEDNNDIYFSIAASTNIKWAGIGLGNEEMAGALYLIIYTSASGKNVTISARTASGHDEPVYDPSINIKALAGTGITSDGIMIFSGRCTNCRSWSAPKKRKRDSDGGGGGDGGGKNKNKNKNKIDVTSDAQECIYGLASGGPLNSDDPATSINYHTRYGSFKINLKQAVSPGESEPPNVVEALEAGSTASSGSKVTEDNTTQNWVAIWHAIIMIVCFVGLLPLGVIFLRVMDRVRWHGWNQTLAAIGIIVGTGVGIYDSLRYTRSKNVNSAHQIIGLIAAILMIAQTALGYFHHRIYKQTLHTTKIAPVHVWLGRVLIIAGVVTAFLGFPLGLSNNGQYILAGVVVVVALVSFGLIFWKYFIARSRSRDRQKLTSRDGPGGSGDDAVGMLPLGSRQT